MQPKRRGISGVVFLTVFMDIVGFSVIFPLFPAMLDFYLAAEGKDSLIGRLAQSLAAAVGDPESSESRFAVAVFFGGILGSLYSLLQFLAAPLWGMLSDRIGRRPVLMVTLAGTFISHVAWFFAGSFALLIAARTLGGVMAGNISTASAAVADTTSGRDRARAMGMLGAGIGLGFVVGPALGGLASLWDLSITWPGGAALGVNPFSSAALIAAILGALNWLWAYARFSETLDPAHRARNSSARPLNPIAALSRLDHPGVRKVNVAYLFYLTAFGAMEFTLTFLAAERLDYQPRDNAWMFVYVGVLIALVQGGLVRRLAPRLGERRMVSIGLALTLPGFVIVSLTTSASVLYLGLTFLACGSGLVMPGFSSLASRYVPADRQGFSLGIFRSMGSLARAIGPIAGGALYWQAGSIVTYNSAAALLLVPIGLALLLPAPPEDAVAS